MDTAGTAFLDALVEHGVTHLFANLGSDHPALLEALAAARASGRPVPRLVTCPTEMVALSIAHGMAQVTGRAQAVLVHVDCGTQALAGAVHNASRGRVPVLIFAGLSPATQEGELPGSRNEFIHWIQDVPDQRGIVRGYVRYEAEVRAGANIRQLVRRALQIAESAPAGPAYLTAAREVLEQQVRPAAADPAHWRPVEPRALAGDAVAELAGALAGARNPLLVTSYVGRNPDAVAPLVSLCNRLGMGVLESVPSRMNFPHDDPLYLGSVWNQPVQDPSLAAADLVLVVDSDVPWIPSVNRPAPDARVIHIDADPLKAQMPLWHIGASRLYAADAATALRQLDAALADLPLDSEAVARRRAAHGARHAARAARLRERETGGTGLSVPALLARLRAALPPDAIVLNEGITNYQAVFDHLGPRPPGSVFASGGGSLGWNGGAAIGTKLAAPDREVVILTGDGSYLFSDPVSVHWIARRYGTPFLQIVLNNGGWTAPRQSLLALHPAGFASRNPALGTSFDPPPDYAAVAAAAGGACALRVDSIEAVDAVLAQALHAVRAEGRCAVIDAVIGTA